jgi:hypothetical protein
MSDDFFQSDHVKVSHTTDATAANTGSVQTKGGLYVAKTVKHNGLIIARRVITDADTIGANDHLIICNKATAFTQVLPAATGTGRVYIIKNINTGVVTVDGASAETIDGSATIDVYQWESVQLCDGDTGKWVAI